MPKCWTCKKHKRVMDFYTDRSRGLSSRCRRCDIERLRIVAIRRVAKGNAFYSADPRRRLMKPAHKAVAKAILSGEIHKPSRCQGCHRRVGRPRLQAHHHMGYAYENRLVVIFLCHPCHRSRHPASKKQVNPSRILALLRPLHPRGLSCKNIASCLSVPQREVSAIVRSLPLHRVPRPGRSGAQVWTTAD